MDVRGVEEVRVLGELWDALPGLHRMEEEGLLSREDRLEGGRVRKYYAATEEGLEELERARLIIRELYGEVVEGGGPNPE